MKSRIREWGNSFGVVIPREIILKEGFKVNDEVTILLNKEKNLESFFGKAKIKIDAERAKKEGKKMWKMD